MPTVHFLSVLQHCANTAEVRGWRNPCCLHYFIEATAIGHQSLAANNPFPGSSQFLAQRLVGFNALNSKSAGGWSTVEISEQKNLDQFRLMYITRKIGAMNVSVVKTTCPRDCYDACGISVLVENGAIRKVMGDRDHHVSRGALCGKCALGYNGPFIDLNQRLASPLRRSGPKGSGHFKAVSWDEAIGEIADRMKAILAQAAPTTVLHTHYTGTVAMIAGGSRSASSIGSAPPKSTRIRSATRRAMWRWPTCSAPRCSGFDPEQLPNATALMVWGANPSHSAPHMHRDWVKSPTPR